MLRVILVDDEPFARQGMRQLLDGFPNIQIIGEADNVPLTLEIVQKEPPDAIFLDINMPGASGFELLKKLEPVPKIVFVTAYAEYAALAFEVDAVDYLLKPVRPERLAAAIKRLEAACDRESPLSAKKTVGLGLEDRICLRTPERTVITAVERIILFEADGDFVRVHIADGSSLLICRTLSHFEPLMPHPPFLRLGRSLMVNLSHVLRFEPSSRDETRLFIQGLTIPLIIGRAATARLKEALAGRP
jgi:two-component system LytT family response regulator